MGEEIKGVSKMCSPRTEIDGSGWILKRGGEVWAAGGGLHARRRSGARLAIRSG
jgi:hypothetical protein